MLGRGFAYTAVIAHSAHSSRGSLYFLSVSKPSFTFPSLNQKYLKLRESAKLKEKKKEEVRAAGERRKRK